MKKLLIVLVLASLTISAKVAQKGALSWPWILYSKATCGNRHWGRLLDIPHFITHTIILMVGFGYSARP